MEKIQEIELTIKSADDGVFAISLVDQPAIEENFVALAAQDVEFKVVDEERRIVVGFALVPEKRILRLMGGKKFNIYFTKETVAQAAEDFMKKMMLKKFTTDHEEKVDGITVIESWVVEDSKNDKSNLYNLNAKGGEWVLMSKIDNDAVWNEVKAGKFKGYSIEARFDGFEQLQSKTETMEEQIIKELNALLSSDEVKLGRIEELKKLMIEANRGAMKAIDLANSAKKPAEDSLKLNKTLLVQFESVKKIVKDLGLDDADITKQIQQVKENISTINSVLDALYKI
jgi:biotin operon repressor